MHRPSLCKVCLPKNVLGHKLTRVHKIGRVCQLCYTSHPSKSGNSIRRPCTKRSRLLLKNWSCTGRRWITITAGEFSYRTFRSIFWPARLVPFRPNSWTLEKSVQYPIKLNYTVWAIIRCKDGLFVLLLFVIEDLRNNRITSNSSVWTTDKLDVLWEINIWLDMQFILLNNVNSIQFRCILSTLTEF